MNTVFEKYKDLHKGERIFLIANGPSLADTNLNYLDGEITMAMNKVSAIYPQNPQWLPTYYLFSSTNVNNPIWGDSWTSAVRRSLRETETTSFVAAKFRARIDPRGNYPHVNWFDSLSETKPTIDGLISESCFSRDVVERIDKSGTTMNLALQLVYYMGFKEIIFVGADLGWSKDLGSESDPNHFDKSYRANIPNPHKANHQMRNIHSLAYKNFMEKDKDIKFYNASLKTSLDVYPLIDYESYILKNKLVFLKEREQEARAFWDKPHQYKI